MTLRLECECGKSYRLADDAAGNRFKCEECGKALTAPEVPGPRGTCPNCGQHLEPGARFCTGCGRNLETGQQRAAAPDQPADAEATTPGGRKQRQIAVPWALVVPGLLVVVAGVLAWLFVIRPMAARSALNEAMELAEEARYGTAAKRLEESRSKVYGEYAEELEFRIGQMKMQKKYAAGGGPSPEGASLGISVLPQMERSSGKLLVHVAIINRGDEPVPLGRKVFYLRGKSGLVQPIAHKKGSLEGKVVLPGGMAQGIVAFRKLPGSPLGMATAKVTEPQELVYNDGVRYVPVRFSMLGAIE